MKKIPQFDFDAVAPAGGKREFFFFPAVIGAGLLLACYLFYQWLNRPPNDSDFILAAWPTFNEINQNIHLALSGYLKGYARTVQGYLAFLLLSLSFLSVGKLLLSRSPFKGLWSEILASEKIGLSFLIGSLFFSLLWMVLGLLGALKSSLALVIAILGTGLFIFQSIKSRNHQTPMVTKHDKVFFYVLSGILLLRSVMSVETQTYSDTLLTHLALPNLYIQHGHIMGSPYNIYTYFPQNTEALVMWCLLLKSEMAAALLMIAFFAAMIMLAWGFLRRNASDWGAVAEALLIGSIPTVLWFSGTIKNDFPSGVFLFAHFCALKEAVDHRRQRPDLSISWILLAGLLCGGAMGHKFTAIISFAVTFTILIWISVRDRTYKLAGMFFVGFIASILPWMLRTFILTGDPIYPYLASSLGLKLAAPWHSTEMISGSTGRLGIQGLTDYFKLLPGVEAMRQPTWGPSIMLALASIGALFYKSSTGLKVSIISAFTSWVVHLFYSTEIRYHMGFVLYLAGIPFFILVKNSSKRFQIATWAFAIITFCAGILYTSIYNLWGPALAKLISGYSNENYSIEFTDRQAQNLSWMSHLINTRTKKSDGLLLAGVFYSYGIERKVFFSNDRDKQIIIDLAEESSDAFELREKLRKLGVVQILLSRDFFQTFSSLPNDRMRLKPDDAEKIAAVFNKATIRFATTDGQIAWLTLNDSGDDAAPVILNSTDALNHPTGYLSAVLGQYIEKNYGLANALLDKAEEVPMNRFNKANVVLYKGAIEVLAGEKEKGYVNMEKAIEIAPDLYSSYITLARFYIVNNFRLDRVPQMLKTVIQRGGYRDIINDPLFAPFLMRKNS